MELYNSRWRAHCHVKQAPHRLAAAALVDLQQHFLVRGHLLGVGTQHRQLEHRQIDALPCALLLPQHGVAQTNDAAIRLTVNGSQVLPLFTDFKANQDHGSIGVVATGGSVITSFMVEMINYTTGAEAFGFKQVKQMDVSLANVGQVPAPAALPIVASALVGFGFAGFRRRDRA